MRTQEQIASMLDRFMAAETTEQEERQLAEYFRTATAIPDEWRPYADMFRIFDEGMTRLSDSELESGAATTLPVQPRPNSGAATTLPEQHRPHSGASTTPSVTPHASVGQGSGRRNNVRLGVRLNKWATSIAAVFCLGAVAATIGYRALGEAGAPSEVSENSEVSERCELPKAPAPADEHRLADTLVFNNIPLSEIARQIGGALGCRVVVEDEESAGLRLYFTLPKGSTAADFATVIDDYEALAASIEGDTVTIKRQEAAR